MGFVTVVLLDTCVLLWWTLAPESLSENAAETCNKIKAEGAFISSISIWEIGIKQQRGKLDLADSLSSYVDRLKALGSIEIIPVDENIWLRNLALDWENRDPADRTIVATAMLKSLPIVTRDQVIRDFYEPVIW